MKFNVLFNSDRLYDLIMIEGILVITAYAFNAMMKHADFFSVLKFRR